MTSGGPDEIRYEYDAFISYRHVPRDMELAKKLHQELETYRVPKKLVRKGYPSRLTKVFRDREELPSSSDLSNDITEALKKSRFLIILCSPDTVQSQWVLKEVELFAEYHGYDRILALLVEGEPADSFPPGLVRYIYDESGSLNKVIEPLAADIRPVEGRKPFALLKEEKLRLIASIIGCKFDQLRQREQERKIRRIITLSAAGTAFLLAFGLFVLWQLSEVSAAREVAVRNEKLAQEEKDNALANQSVLYASLAKKAADDGDMLLGMSLAMEALPKDIVHPERPLTQEAQDALYYSAAQYGMQERTRLYPPDATAQEIAQWCFFNSAGDVVTVSGRAVRQFSPDTGRLSHEWMAAGGYEILAVSPQADRAIIARYQPVKGMDVQLWDIANGRMVIQQTLDLGDDERLIREWLDVSGTESMVKAGFEPDGKRFFIGYNEHFTTGVRQRSRICLYDSASGAMLDSPNLTFENLLSDVLINGGQLVASIYSDDPAKNRNILVYDIQKNVMRRQVSADDYTYISVRDQLRTLGITSDGKKLAFVTEGFILHIVDVDSGESQEIPTDSCEISSNGNLAAFFRNDEKHGEQFVVQDLVRNKPLVVLENSPTLQLPRSLTTILYSGFTFCSNGRYILFDDSEMLDIERAELYLLPMKDRMYADSDSGGKYMAYVDQYGTGSVIQMKDTHVSEYVVSGENEAALRNDGVLLFDNSGRGTLVRKWDAAQKTVSNTAQEDSNVRRLCNINGGYIGYVGSKSYLYEQKVFNMGTGLDVVAFQTDKDVFDFDLDPSGKQVIAMTSDGAFLFDAQTGRQIRQLSSSYINGSQSSSMRCVGFFPDGKFCWSAEYQQPEDDYTGIVIYDVETGKVANRIPISIQGDFSASMTSDGSRMVVQPLHTLQLWSIGTQMNPACIGDLQGEFFCMDDSVIVTNDSAGPANTLYIYDIKTGLMKSTIKLPDTYNGYKGILANGGKYLLTITASSAELGVPAPAANFSPIRLTLWDCGTGKSVATLYNDYSMGTDILDFGLVNSEKEVGIVSRNNGKTFIRTIPFFTSFDEVYGAASEKLSGRTFDFEQDAAHIN